MTGLDLSLPSRGLTPSQALDLAVEAERSGWSGVWVSEVLDLDALVMMGAMAARTGHVRLGTAIVPITTRSAATLAMAASTLGRLAPGRFSLGVGISTPVLVDRRHDRAVRRPVAESRGVIEVLRAVLRGERVDHDEDPSVQDLRVPAPEDPPPVLLAALGPQMTGLAVAEADGLVLNLVPFEEAGARARRGRERDDSFETAMLIRTVVDPTDEDRHSVRRELAGYLRVPAYARELERLGWDVTAVREAADLDTGADVLSDDLAAELSVVGDADYCLERLHTLPTLGVTPLVVPAAGPAAAERTIARLTAAAT